MPDGGLLNLNM